MLVPSNINRTLQEGSTGKHDSLPGIVAGHPLGVRLLSHCTWQNARRLFSGSLLAAAIIGCFLWRFSMYAFGHPNAELWKQRRELYSWSLPIAKGFGQSAKLIFSLILLPICRNTITFLRSTPLRHFLNFNDGITVHQTLGWLGLVAVAGHTIAHIVDYANQDARGRSALWRAANPGQPNQPTARDSMSTQVRHTPICMHARTHAHTCILLVCQPKSAGPGIPTSPLPRAQAAVGWGMRIQACT